MICKKERTMEKHYRVKKFNDGEPYFTTSQETDIRDMVSDGLEIEEIISTIRKRFFFFTYSYWCEKTEGKGNLSLTSKIGFPTQKDVKQKAIEQVKNRYDEPEYKISVVIESWVEMSEDDYIQWLS